MSKYCAELTKLASSDKLINLAKKWVSSPEDAEDVVQTSLLNAFKAIGRFDPQKAKLTTWLHRIVHNAAMDLLRRKRSKLNQSIEELDLLEASYLEDVGAGIDSKENIAKIKRCLQRLPIKERRLIDLIDIQDNSSVEMAQLLRKASGTIRNYLHNARKSLKEQLRQEDENRFLRQQGLKYCECGCGTKIPVVDKRGRPRRFIKNHHRRNYKKANISKIIKCACGCGEDLLVMDKHGKSNRTHINGHNRRGKCKYDHSEMIECACGCGGKRLRYNPLSGREYRFIKGHNHKMYSTAIERSRAHRAKNKRLASEKGEFPKVVNKYCKYCKTIAPTKHSGEFLADGSPQYRNKCIDCKRKHGREYMRKKRSA